MGGETKSNKLAGFFVAGTAFLVYANSLLNGFVGDDQSVILHNPVLRGSILSLFSAIDTMSETQLLPYYRPVTYLTFLMEGRLHGFRPLPMHLINVMLHAANAFLVFRLACSLLNDQRAALLTGLLFAVHPVHSESVNFLSGGRNTMLACIFVLLAYLIHRRSISRDSWVGGIAGAVFFLLGLFSKETALMIFPFIAAVELPQLRDKSEGARLRAAMRLFPYVVATMCYLVMRWMTLSGLGIQTGIIPGFSSQMYQSIYIIPSLRERIFNNLYVIPKYLLTVIWPISLSPRYVVPEDLNLLALPLTVAWLSIMGGIGWLFAKGRSSNTLFGMSWLIAFWLPSSGIIFFASAPLADRYLYLSAIGLWIIIADQTARSLPAGSRVARYGVVVASLVFLVLAGLTIRRNMDWKSDMTLFTRLVEQYPDNPYGHANLAAAYIKKNTKSDLAIAEKEYQRALALDPSQQSVYTPLGYIRLELGDFEGALFYYSEALAIFPLDKEARINRGIAYEKLGRYREALADYQFFLATPGHNTIPGSEAYAEERIRELSKFSGM